MPFCDIAKDVSLYYITNSPKGDATDLDRSRPTIILLPPPFCAVLWLREQFKDTRLSSQYNLLAFDQRNMGLTRAPLSPLRDTWVDAADLAVAHEILQLPPCHVFTVAMNPGVAALRFATLFPDKCLSLCLCAAPVQAGEDPEWVEQGYREITAAWCFPKDLEGLERACMELSLFAFSGQISSALEDELIAWWQVNMPPTKRSNFLAQALCALNRSRLSDQELASIIQPALFIQGDKSLINPPHKAQEISSKMPNCRLFVVNGGPELLNIVPEYASVVNRVYCQFLGDIPRPPEFQPTHPDTIAVCKAGLKRLSKLAADSLIAERDPSDIFSFCLYTSEVIEQNIAQFAVFAEGEAEAFHSLNEMGQPIRKFSERHMNEWIPATLERMQRNTAPGGTLVTVVQSSVSSQDGTPVAQFDTVM